VHPTRLRAGIALVVALGVGAAVVVARRDSSGTARTTHAVVRIEPTSSTSAAQSTVATSTSTTASTTTTVPHNPADDFVLTRVATVNGAISPKSVTATGTGLVFAQNMMYRHTMTVYDAAGALVKTIPDTVDLAQFGFTGHPGTSPLALLGDAIRTGSTPGALFEDMSGDNVPAKRMTAAMDAYARSRGVEIADRLDFSKTRRLLDMGCGPGTYSLAIVERNPNVRGYSSGTCRAP